jgi:SAM-dependent methyltransferase
MTTSQRPGPTLDIDAITEDEKPTFQGIDFDSRPAALRQLLLVQEIIEEFPDATKVVGLDIGSKYPDLSTMLDRYDVKTVRLDTEWRRNTDRFVVADGQRSPFQTGAFDFAVLSHVMAHVDDIDALIEEARRIIRPGGTLFIMQNNKYGWWKFWGYYLKRNDRRAHQRTFAEWDMRDVLARHGFAVDHMYPPYYFYLHSKLSKLFYRIDRHFGGKVPNVIATQWVVAARRVADDAPAPTRVPPPNIGVRALLIAFAVGQAVGVKAIEIGLRTIHRPGWGKAPD